MAHYLDPKNDLTFKRIFGEHDYLCISLLNNMLPLEKDQQIISIKYQPGELLPVVSGLKNSIVDVCCTDNRGRHFIVEMQMYWTSSFMSRVLFNASKAYVKQLDGGGDYTMLKPVYSLNFINDSFDSDDSAYYHDYRIINVADASKRINGIELVFIELPKFRPKNRADSKLYDLWLTFLTQIKNDSEAVPKELLENELTRDAVQCLEQTSYTRVELDTYDKFLDVIRVERTFHADALAEGLALGEALGIEKGKAEGIAEGKAEGIAEGKAEGKAEGIAEGEAIGIEKGKAEGKAEVVIACSRTGIPLEQIQSITGLSIEKIEEILCAGSEGR
ncbi:MAG: Rpn family recombination-promoting nuclease/putative transposase [Tannerellaceae bacterium]|nr:Rpn family recombination-promoting nuclease/putative transposase [Tannerellaceae bacterium]